MTASIDDILGQLSKTIKDIDTAVALMIRLEHKASQAHDLFVHAGRGSEHPAISNAIATTREARDKAGKTGRLLGESAKAFSRYMNTIAPGSAPKLDSATPGTMPTGERLVSEAEQRGSRFDRAFEKHVRKADDTEDALKQVEDSGKAAYKYLKQGPPEPGSTSAGTAPSQPPVADRPQVDNPITAIVMATGAMVVAGKAALNHAKKRNERKRDDDAQA